MSSKWQEGKEKMWLITAECTLSQFPLVSDSQILEADQYYLSNSNKYYTTFGPVKLKYEKFRLHEFVGNIIL